jgi:hypothetical protein
VGILTLPRFPHQDIIMTKPKSGLYLVPSAPRDADSELERHAMASISGYVHQSLWNAIETRHQIRFHYNGKLRISEPHDYGIQNGRARLLTYQLGGESNSGPLPAWRWFDVAKISDLEILDRPFPGNRPAPSGHHHHWDKIFLRVADRS